MDSQIKKMIEDADVVSFDIFDTLLIRPYCKPTDLFVHLERVYSNEGYANARIEAEKNARKASRREEITFDEIYRQIENKYARLKEAELKAEHRVLHKNPPVAELYDYAKAIGKRIVIASDMYLDAEFLKSALLKEGYGGFEKLYVSSEVMKTKWNGGLFDCMLKDLGVPPSKILHIGDNIKSDVEIPQGKGIVAYHVKRPIDAFFSENPKMRKFYDAQKGNIACSITLALCAEYNEADGYWHKFGFFYGGVSAAAYVQWMLPIIRKKQIEQMLFVARDGYSLVKVFNILCENINAFYVAAPRIINLLITGDYKDKLHEANILKNKYFEFIGEVAIQDFNNISDADKFFIENKSKLAEMQNFYARNYALYLEKEKVDASKNSCCVETYSWNCSAQNLLSSFVPSVKDNGVYIQSHPNPKLHYDAFLPGDSFKFKYFKKWDIMELIFSAPTPPIRCIDSNGVPNFNYSHMEYEKTRMDLYPALSGGIVEFAKKIGRIFGDIPMFATGEFIADWINFFTDNISEDDAANFKNVHHAVDSDHGFYRLLLPDLAKTVARESFYLFDAIPVKLEVISCDNVKKVKFFKIEIFKIKHKRDRIKFYIFGICIFARRIAK